jgi:hypothetical protein
MLSKCQILSFKEFDKRLKTFVNSHNNLNDTLSTQIRISRKSALRNLANAYRNYIHDFKNNINWETTTTIPEMPMRRKTVSKMVGCCEKTAYNHIKFLIEAGVFVKTLHGRQNDFGLYLNPYFWLSECEKLPNLVLKKSTPTASFPLSLGNFLPPISFQDFQESKNYYKADVETVDKVAWETSKTTPPQFQPSESDYFSRKSSEQTAKSQEKPLNTQKPVQEEIGAVAAELSTFSGKLEQVINDIQEKSNGADTVRGNESLRTSEVPPQSSDYSSNEAEAWSLAKRFTDYALTNIYQSNQFNKNFFVSEAQYHEIKNLIMSDVFGNFQNATNDVWKIRQTYTDAMLAVDKAIAYAKKHNWESFLHPKCYFSKTFKNSGRKGTFFEVFNWQVNDKHKLSELKRDEFLEKAKHHVRFSKPPRGRRDLTTPLQISSHFKLMIAKRCGAYYVSLFNQFLSNPQNF